MKIKPFLRWAGGKQNLVDSILANAPNDELINKYYEPFLGAGSLFFANGFSNAVISDVNPQLINSFSAIKNDYLKVHNLIQSYYRKFKKNPSYYYQIRELYNKNKTKNNYVQAARFIFLIHSNFNGMYRVNKNGDYNVPIGKLNPSLPTLEQLEIAHNKMKKTEIRCTDYRRILNEVNENDFVYLDPPYPPLEWPNIENQYTVDRFKKEDHESIAAFAEELRLINCFVMISYPDMPFIRELYQGWNIVELNIVRSISGQKQRKKVTELLIKNY